MANILLDFKTIIFGFVHKILNIGSIGLGSSLAIALV